MMSTLFLTRSSNVPAMMYKLFVFVTFLAYFNLSQSGCPIIANKKSIDSLFGRNQTLVCSLKRCKSASWFNLTEGSYLNSCDSQVCSTSLQATKEIILKIHNLSPYQTGTYICVCKEPRIKTIKCFDIIGVCQMWIEVNNHTMELTEEHNLKSAERLNYHYVNLSEHDTLGLRCLPGATLQSNCSDIEPKASVSMMLNWCNVTCAYIRDTKHPCSVQVIFKVTPWLSNSPRLSTLPLPTSELSTTLQTWSVLEVTSLFTTELTSIDERAPPQPTSPSLYSISLTTSTSREPTTAPSTAPTTVPTTAQTKSLMTTHSPSLVRYNTAIVHLTNEAGIHQPIESPLPSDRSITVVYFMITSTTFTVLLLLFATTLWRIYLVYVKGEDKDRTDVYRPSSVYASSLSNGKQKGSYNEQTNSATQV